MLIDPLDLHFIYRRASFEAYKKFHINKFELQTLCALSSFLRAHSKTIISWQEFSNSVTGNRRESNKLKGSYHGLQNKGFIGSYEYLMQPGSLCVGISDKGRAAIGAYLSGLDRLSVRMLKESPAGNSAGKFKEDLSRYRNIAT